MKEILSIFIFLIFPCSPKAQTNFFGEFKYHTENSESLAFNYILDLNCDKTFRMTDSATNSKVLGFWFIKNSKELILSIDSTKLKSDISTKKRKWVYIIKNGRLYEKPLTEGQYQRQNRHLNRLMSKQTGENSQFEDYETFKSKQEARYFLKIKTFSCP
jgi:hypothetical protein